LNLLGLGSVFRIEHAADHPLIKVEAAGEFRVADALIAHGQVERKPQRHGHQRWPHLAGEA